MGEGALRLFVMYLSKLPPFFLTLLPLTKETVFASANLPLLLDCGLLGEFKRFQTCSAAFCILHCLFLQQTLCPDLTVLIQRQKRPYNFVCPFVHSSVKTVDSLLLLGLMSLLISKCMFQSHHAIKSNIKP